MRGRQISMNKAIFWDLLGTLGGDSRTLINQNFNFFKDTIPALKKAAQSHYLNIIITNQSHISHGRITMAEYTDALESLINELEKNDIQITDVYTCPHARKDNCDCKKPQPTFVNEALKKYDLNPSKCFVVGDSGKNDMMLAKNAGINSVLLLTGEGIDSLTKYRHLWSENSLDAINKIHMYAYGDSSDS